MTNLYLIVVVLTTLTKETRLSTVKVWNKMGLYVKTQEVSPRNKTWTWKVNNHWKSWERLGLAHPSKIPNWYIYAAFSIVCGGDSRRN
jgi:hypothetical protein